MRNIIILAACVALGYARTLQQPEIKDLLAKPVTEVLYNENEPVKLKCDITTEVGKNVKYQWLKDGKPFPEDAKFTEGVYQCLATSELGVASSGRLSLKKAYFNLPTVETKKHTPVDGEPFQMDCPQVDAYPKPTVEWQLQEGASPPQKYLTVRSTVGPDNTLYIANITQEDVNANSKYICAVPFHPALDKPALLAQHVIEGLKPSAGVKKAVPQYLSSDIVAKEGEQIFIYCIYGGAIAPPDYFFEGSNVNGDENPASQRVTRHNRSKGRRLLIRDVRLADQGEYSCKIADVDRKTVTHTMRLAVVSAPKIKSSEPKILAKEDEDVTIPCEASGVPSPKISWTYNSKPLSTDSRISIESTGKSDGAANVLKIKGVKKSDKGYYGCTAISEVGEDYKETLLQVA